MFQLNTKPPYHCIHCGYSQNISICRYYNGHRKTGSVNNVLPNEASSPIPPPTKTNYAYVAMIPPNQASQHITAHCDSMDSPDLNQSSVKHLRLTQCLKCNQLVDEYIQLDYCILFLDAVLQKTSFYRHILLNCTIDFRASMKILVLLSLCDAHKRWADTLKVLSGNNYSNENNKRTPQHTEEESYLDLELSFYVAFASTVITNIMLYFILFITLNILTKSNYYSYKKPFDFKERLPDYIICSYGKLFTLPNILWGGELSSIIELLIEIFHFISLTQCCYVCNKSLSRTKAAITVLITVTIHQIILFCLTKWWYHLINYYELKFCNR